MDASERNEGYRPRCDRQAAGLMKKDIERAAHFAVRNGHEVCRDLSTDRDCPNYSRSESHASCSTRHDHESVVLGASDTQMDRLSINWLCQSESMNDITGMPMSKSCFKNWFQFNETGGKHCTQTSTQQGYCQCQMEEKDMLPGSVWLPAVATHMSVKSQTRLPIETSSPLWPAFGAKMSRLALDRLLLKEDEPDEVPVAWKPVSPVPGRGLYMNRLASIDTGTVAIGFHGDELYTTDAQFTEWKTCPVDFDMTVANIVSLNGKCYSFMKHRRSGSGEIAQLDVRTGTWHSLVTVTGNCQLVGNETSVFLIKMNSSDWMDDAMQIHKCDVIGKRLECVFALSKPVSINPLLCSAVAIGDKIYMTGTSRSVIALSLCDLSTKLIPNTTNHNCTLLNCGGRLVASGGLEGSVGTTSASTHVEIFDPKFNKWHSLPSMTCNRVWHGMSTTNEYAIAVVGGQDRDFLSSAEILYV